MCLSNGLGMAKLVRGLKLSSGETANAMQVGSHLTGAQDPSLAVKPYATEAELGLNLAREYLRFHAILKGSPPCDISEARTRRMQEILALTEDNGWIDVKKLDRAVEFWIWCGLKRERWALIPNQDLWEEFSKEVWLYKDSHNARTPELSDLSMWTPPDF
ncbi:hypothetical protein N7462_011171 [Penicillium macrosclerotiorum]|uniref:uncharacterized protein n=1 Tax=Penicillium macrosclerotiorum TaxID=303699 RepID=UPI002548B800|nr:uncharacterized protein N7462_011171 [Penicillium macrosclerotiorum]KAJ5666762.1 hypothetical protein N7462_011171 [Penicillium macrosclerotiorum]